MSIFYYVIKDTTGQFIAKPVLFSVKIECNYVFYVFSMSPYGTRNLQEVGALQLLR